MMALEFSRVAPIPDIYLYKFPSFKILAEFFVFVFFLMDAQAKRNVSLQQLL